MNTELAEEQRVELWVIEQLTIAGFDGVQQAALLAASLPDPEIWRRACTLVSAGCPHETAVQILT